MTAAGWWRRHGPVLRGCGLGALAVVAFVPGLASPFILLDDPLYVLKNERLHATGWAGFANLWSSADAYRGAFIEFFPLRDSLNWVLFHAFGPVSLPFHLTSLAFHVCATVLVWRLARRLVADEAVAFRAAALFAVHPIHVESVTWVAGLKDPLHVSLMLAACLTFLGWREEPRPWRYGVSLVFLVLALLSKSMAVVTPVLLLALDRLQGPPRPWKESLKAVAAPTAVAGLFLIQFLLIARAAGVVMPPHGGSWLSHATLALWAQVLYLGQMLAPVSSRLIYCFAPATGLVDIRLWAGLALVAGGLVAWWRLRRQPLWRLLLAWYAVCLLPVANLIPFPAVIADRYLYASSIAGCVAAALALRRLRPGLSGPLAGAVVAVCLLVTMQRANEWNDEEQLHAAADEDPACMVDPSTYGAKAHFQRAVTARDDTVAFEAFNRAFASAGFSNMTRGQQCGVLLQALKRAASSAPSPLTEGWSERVEQHCPGVSAAWYLAAIVNLSRRPELARTQAEKAAALAPAADTVMLRGLTRLHAGDPAFAEDVRRALELDRAAACGVLTGWARQAAPGERLQVQDALRTCGGAG